MFQFKQLFHLVFYISIKPDTFLNLASSKPFQNSATRPLSIFYSPSLGDMEQLCQQLFFVWLVFGVLGSTGT
jgi:hypothetical protein